MFVWAVLVLAGSQAADVGDLLAPIREKHGIPGLAAVLIEGERPAAAGATGVRKRGAEAKLTIGDRFHLGSCTKAMTATLIATLVADGTLRWNSTVGDAFGDAVHAEWRAVRLEQLLTNSAGAPADLDGDGLWGRLWAHRGTAPEARRLLVDGVVRKAPSAAPGTTYVYSNAGFAIAGAMAEKATGKPWEDLMRERLFGPLGMSTAGFGAPGRPGAVDEPWGHSAAGRAVEPGPAADNPPAIGPAGTVHASLADWAKFVSLHLLRDRHSKVPRGLSRDVFGKLHAPVLRDYAMGWICTTRAWGGAVLTHDGSNTMWYAVAWLAPEKGFAVLAAANQGGDAAARACDDAAALLLTRRAERK